MAGRTTQFVVVTTTTDSEATARKLARLVVDARLAACVQLFPIHSVYRWKGAVESASEHLLLAKTRQSLAGKLTAFILKNHTYEVPEITVTPILGGLNDYLKWIVAETRQDPDPAGDRHSEDS